MKRQNLRKTNRSKTFVNATIETADRTFRGTIVDVSPSGVRLRMARDFTLRSKTEVLLRTHEIGVHLCHVRWQSGNDVGLQFDVTTNTAAQIDAYYKHFARYFHQRSAS